MSHELIIIDKVTVDVSHEDLTIKCTAKPCSWLTALQVARIVWKYLRT